MLTRYFKQNIDCSGAFWNYKNKVSPAASRILDDIIKHKQFYTYGKQYSADDIYK